MGRIALDSFIHLFMSTMILTRSSQTIKTLGERTTTYDFSLQDTFLLLKHEDPGGTDGLGMDVVAAQRNNRRKGCLGGREGVCQF